MTSGKMRQQYPSSGDEITYRVSTGEGRIEVELGGTALEIDITHRGPSHGWCRWNGRLLPFDLAWVGGDLHLWLNGSVFVFSRLQEASRSRRGDGVGPGDVNVSVSGSSIGGGPPPDDKHIISPMAGRVLSVSVSVGDPVSSGDEVCLIEAMKMEHSVRCSADGVVASVNAEAGQQVSSGELLVLLE